MSPADDAAVTMKVLYVKGAAADADEPTLLQLRSQAAELDITVSISAAAALAEIRRTRGWHALLLSPALPQNETLALIASVRRDRVPIAIVPIVDEMHRDVFAAAVAAGADDVLVRRGQTLVNVAETLTRIWQSPHLFPAEQRRKLTVLYAGRDPLVWNLLEQVPFVKAEKVAIGPDGSCPVRMPGATDGALRCDAVVIDEQPGEAHPLQILKSVKAQASDLPVIVLTSTTGGDIATAALDLGADDTVLKTGVFRRRLVATLRRVHQRLEISGQQIETKAREERLRQIVENVPAGITVIAADGAILAMNATALHLFGAAKPRDLVGRDVRQLVVPAHHEAIAEFVRRVLTGEATATAFTAITLAGQEVPVRLHGVLLERDARGGRGIVASVTMASSDLPLGGVSTTGELADLRGHVGDLQTRQAQIEETHARERAAWDEERQRLAAQIAAAGAELARIREASERERDAAEHRSHELEAAAQSLQEAQAAREVLDQALAESQARAAAQDASIAAERAAWQQERDALAARAQSLDAALTDQAAHASGALALREEIEALRATHARERADLETRRQALERELHGAREAHQAVLADQTADASSTSALREEIEALRAAHAQERTDLEARHQLLEQELRHAREALWAEHGERDAARERFDAEVRSLRELFASERAEWERGRAEAELHVREAREHGAALERDLAAAHADRDADRQRALDAFDGERHDWRTTQTRLEQDAHAAAARADGLEADLAAARAQLETERAALRDAVDEARRQAEASHADAIAHARAEADARVSALDTELAALRDRAAALETDLHAARAEHGNAHEALHQQFADERTAWQTTQARLEHEAATAAERASALDAELAAARDRAAALETELHAARAEHGNAHEALHQQFADERNAWQTTQARLEHEAATAAERANALDAELAAARDRAAALETELHDARGVADAARRDADAAIDDARRAWDANRDDLERQRDAAQQLADAAHGEMAAAREAHDSARQVWEASRASLEDELHRTREDLQTNRRDWEAAREDLDRRHADQAGRADRAEQDRDEARRHADDQRRAAESLAAEHQQLADTLAAARREWDDQRGSLEALLRRAHDDADSLQRELEATQAQLERDRADARQAAERERTDWESARTALEAALDAARAEILNTDAMHAEQRAAWDADRAALDGRVRDLDAALAAQRQASDRERETFEALGREADAARQQIQRLEDALGALRSDYATMVQTLNADRAVREQLERDAASLRATISDAERREADLRRTFEHAAREADQRAARRDEVHAARVRALEDELGAAAARLIRVTDEAEAARLALQAEYLRASESHTRLTSSGLFAYAVTTLPGELVRCNDTFARLFGFDDAPDALTRTAGRLFPGLSGRAALAARLTAEGRVDSLESCVERHDGEAVRIVESLTLMADEQDDEPLVEHVIVGEPAGPDPEQWQARRLEEVGALTTAMMPEIETLAATSQERAHDLRRLLRDAEPGPDAENLAALASQINALVRQLATFSRRQTRGVEAVDLGEAVTRTEPVLVRLVGDYVGFALHLTPAPPVFVNRDDLDQLLTSMVTFARDLLPAGGSLGVSVQPPAARAEGDGPAATVLAVTASGYGVQLPGEAASIEIGARRCGGRLRLSGEPGWSARLEIHFARCGAPAKRAWSWDADGN